MPRDRRIHELPGGRELPEPRDRPGAASCRSRGIDGSTSCPEPRDRPGAASCRSREIAPGAAGPLAPRAARPGARLEPPSCRSRSDADTTPTWRPLWTKCRSPSGHVRPIDTATQRSAAISDRIGLHLWPIAPRGRPRGRICGRNRASPTARAGWSSPKRRICPPAGQSGGRDGNPVTVAREASTGDPDRRRRGSSETRAPGRSRVAVQVSAVRFRKARSNTRSASGPNRTKTARSIECAWTMPSRTAARATAAARSIG